MRYEFEGYALDPKRRELRQESGVVPVEPQVFDLLVYLIRQRERVVSKVDLIAEIWEGRGVSDSAIAARVNAARTAIGDNGVAQRLIKTLPRKGMRFVGAVRERDDGPAAASGVVSTEIPPALPLPDRPSIAVLPFANLSSDAEQDYFADGMVEDIVTGLARIKWLFVIARNSSFAYKGRAVDTRQIGRELGVRYVLEGGVRKSGHHVRITTQLLDADTRKLLWSGKYDGTLENVFELQDRITDSVVGILEPSLRQIEIERARRKHPENLDAYDLYLRALPLMTAAMPVESMIAASFLDRALELDPNYAVAHAYKAWSHEICFARGGFGDADRIAGLRHARAAIANGGDDATALAISALVIAHLGKDYESALSAIERALWLNPSCATALFFGAHISAFSGKTGAAAAYADRALRLSPFDPLAFETHQALGFVAIQEERYDEAASCFAKAVQANSLFSWLYFIQAMALALAGRPQEARPIVERGFDLQPNFQARVVHAVGIAPSIADKFAEGARLLGIPE